MMDTLHFKIIFNGDQPLLVERSQPDGQYYVTISDDQDPEMVNIVIEETNKEVYTPVVTIRCRRDPVVIKQRVIDYVKKRHAIGLR